MSRTLPLVLAVAVVAFAALEFVEAPPRSARGYRDRAAETAKSLRSQAQSARLFITAVERGRIARPAVTVALEEAEQDANRAASRFEKYDPPAGQQPLRAELTGQASELTSALAELRIAAHTGDWSSLPRRAESLARLSHSLDQLTTRAKR